MRQSRVSAGMVALLLVLIVGVGCDQGTSIVAPEVTGTISGTVTIDGVGAAGVTVSMSTGVTATTGATGQYSFTNVQAGAFTVTISGYPADVSFPTTTNAVVLATSGQVITLNFPGTRASTSHAGRLTVVGGNAAHDQFVFNAGGGKDVVLALAGSTLFTITPGAGFSPSSFPTLSGSRVGSAFSAAGFGTIANVAGVSVTALGSVTNGRLDIEIVVGADGRLPGGQPIRYRFLEN
jgi:hypothetical protein